MSGFDSIVAEASVAESRAKAIGAKLASYLPTSAPARIEVVAERTSHLRSIVMPLVVVAALVWAYRSGGESARADLDAYRASAAEALAAEKQREITTSQTIRDAADKRQGEDKRHADALQSRIDDRAGSTTMPTPSHHALRMLAALSLTTTCAGCAKTLPPVTEIVRPSLPAPAASFGRPVSVPAMRAGQDVRLANAQARGALDTANHRLMADDAFYDAVCRDFSSSTCKH